MLLFGHTQVPAQVVWEWKTVTYAICLVMNGYTTFIFIYFLKNAEKESTHPLPPACFAPEMSNELLQICNF